MDFSSICRTCLGTKYLNPIFKGKDNHDSFTANVLITTGLKVERNDGLPQQMCNNCMTFLKDALKFRQTCKAAEIQLKNIKKKHENGLKNINIQKCNRRRKKSRDITNNDYTNVKIEANIGDEVPLLQQNLIFKNLSITDRKCDKNVKTETELVMIDKIDQDSYEIVKNEATDENKLEINRESIDDQKFIEHEQEIDIEMVSNRKLNKNRQEIVNQFANDEKFNETDPKFDNEFEYIVKNNLGMLETEADITDESKYETEFLDLNFDSDTDEHLNKDREIIGYNMETSKYNMEIPKTEIPKYNIEIPKYNIEVPEYNMKFPDYNIENVNYNFESPNNTEHQIYYTKVKKRKLKHRKIKKDLENKQNPQKDTENMPSIGLKEYSQLDSENIPFIIQDGNRVTCKLCQKDLSRRSIDSHMSKSHPGADGRKVKCELCDTYVLKERLKRHKIVMHGQDCFKCGYCKTEYESKELLLDHVSTCTDKKRKRKTVDKRKEVIVECNICNKSMQKASLRLHTEIKHAGMGPVCEHCGRRFGNKLRLSEHLRSKHGYEKFKCSMCDFLSASSAAIKNHERRHRGEKPYVCEQCGAKFHAPHLLAQHKQSHRTEKIMKCDQCPAAFKANNTLHMHKITCHNTKTYQCPLCSRTYRARHYAMKHLRTVHRHTGPVGDLLVGPKEPRDLHSPTST